MFLGLLKGLIRELCSLINWIASILITIIIRPSLTRLLSSAIKNYTLNNIISISIIFIFIIILISILTSHLSKLIDNKFPYSINLTLGVAFGFLKGFIISSLIFASIITLVDTPTEQEEKVGPKWLQESILYKPLSFGSYLITPVARALISNIKEKYSPEELMKMEENKLEDEIENNLDNVIKIEKEINNKTEDSKNNKIKTYSNINKTSKDTKQNIEIEKKKEKENKKVNKNKMEILKFNNFDNEEGGVKIIQHDTSEQVVIENDNGGYKKDQMDDLNHLIDIIN